MGIANSADQRAASIPIQFNATTSCLAKKNPHSKKTPPSILAPESQDPRRGAARPGPSSPEEAPQQPVLGIPLRKDLDRHRASSRQVDEEAVAAAQRAGFRR